MFFPTMKFFRLTKHQQDIIQKQSSPLKKAEEQILLRKIGNVVKNDLMPFMLNLEALLERHGLGLSQLASKSFRFNLLNQQLENMKPLPNDRLNNAVEGYMFYTRGFHTIMMLQQVGRISAEIRLSLEVSLGNRAYTKLVEMKLNDSLVRINMEIRELEKEASGK